MFVLAMLTLNVSPAERVVSTVEPTPLAQPLVATRAVFVEIDPSPEPERGRGLPEPEPAFVELTLTPSAAAATEPVVVATRFVAPVERGVAPVHLSEVSRLADSVGLDPDVTLSVGLCESGVDTDGDQVVDALDANAVGSAGERGMMQIHPIHRMGLVYTLGYTWDEMFQPGPNMVVASAIHDALGWSAWSCF